jgi:UDP-N-acetylglucosamine 2-epimerase (non-hydrolysing)
MSRVIVAYGTRPEQIKIEPVAVELERRGVEVLQWYSGQSKDLIEGCDPDIHWKNLHEGIGRNIYSFSVWLEEQAPVDVVMVQGDTATAFACAQAAFLARIPVAHVEAGLRTYADEPWPEEAFRHQIAAVARWHFCPDKDAAQNIIREMGHHPGKWADNYDQLGIFVTGNTVIDTLPQAPLRVLVTLHRRENWGDRIRNALWHLEQFMHDNYPDVWITVIRHPNWRAQGVEPHVSTLLNITDPMPREYLLDYLQSVDLVVTDSGGLQEEAAHFGIPCLVLRTSTERVALERTGAVTMIHPDNPAALRDALDRVLARRRCYGDGDAAEKIAEILAKELAG